MHNAKRFSTRSAALAALALSMLTSACAEVFPISGSVPEELGDDRVMIGMTMEAVTERLGEPDRRYRKDDRDLLLYQRFRAADGVPVVFLPIPLPLPAVVYSGRTTRWCLLLDFDSAGVLTQRQIDYNYLKRYSFEEKTDCSDLFWTRDEFVALLKATAEQGDIDAALELSREFDEPRYIRALAEQGDKKAALELVKAFNDPGPLRKLFESGQDVTEELFLAGFFAGNFVLSWPWYCLAANQGHARAQYELGNYYSQGLGKISKDHVKAYIWYSLAEQACCKWKYRSEIMADEMTPSDLAEAERLVVEWQPDLAECQMEPSQTN